MYTLNLATFKHMCSSFILYLFTQK